MQERLDATKAIEMKYSVEVNGKKVLDFQDWMFEETEQVTMVVIKKNVSMSQEFAVAMTKEITTKEQM